MSGLKKYPYRLFKFARSCYTKKQTLRLVWKAGELLFRLPPPSTVRREVNQAVADIRDVTVATSAELARIELAKVYISRVASFPPTWCGHIRWLAGPLLIIALPLLSVGIAVLTHLLMPDHLRVALWLCAISWTLSGVTFLVGCVIVWKTGSDMRRQAFWDDTAERVARWAVDKH